MANKKADQTASPEDEELERRVKAIMEPQAAPVAPSPAPEPAAEPAANPVQPEALPPLDIFSDQKTAPTLPMKLLKKIGGRAMGANEKPQPEAPAAEANTPDSAISETPTAEPEVATAAEPEAVDIDDSATDQAVDDIVHNESDAVLAAEDAKQADATEKVAPAKKGGRFKRLLRRKWLWLSLLLIAVIGGLMAYPMTRYRLIGLVYKQPLTVVVSDSKTNAPVTDASVTLAGVIAKTNASGQASLKVAPGQTTLKVAKQYYKTYQATQTVGLRRGQRLTVRLAATGRAVPVTVLNRISGKPLANAMISVLDTTALTDAQGKATIVLPTTAISDAASVSLNGYNDASATIQVTNSVVTANTIYLTPSGKVLFLSNLSGTIDVVSTNLDGSGRQTVFKGTGKEDPNATSLLAARDWHYVVLKAARDGVNPALYLINASNNKVTEFDSGNADFTTIGWYGHLFVYDSVRHTTPAWQTGHEYIKSYNADTAQLTLLDQSQAAGNSTSYAYQGFYNFYTLNNLILYNTQWYTYDASGNGYDLSGKSDTVRGIQPDGQGKHDYQSLPASGIGYIQAVATGPQTVDFSAYNYNTGNSAYYQFQNGTVSTPSTVNQSTFNRTYPTYLASPDGNQTFWTVPQDGQNSLFTGDQNAGNQQQLSSLGDYTAYGWYTGSYLLVSKNNSELYVMPSRPLTAGQLPLKVTDYYHPAQTPSNNGYGYGGL